MLPVDHAEEAAHGVCHAATPACLEAMLAGNVAASNQGEGLSVRTIRCPISELQVVVVVPCVGVAGRQRRRLE